jgi:CRISPR system Cascade subunit CasB
MKYSLSSEEQSALLRWHKWLDDNRGDRARLRRAECAEDVLLTDAFFHFLQHMPDSWRKKKPMLSSAAVAGLLSHIKFDNSNASFAALLARPVKGDKPAMSELRFQQLQKSSTTQDFYRRILRAIHLLGGSANVVSLGNDIIHWHQEFENKIDREPAKRLAVRWATDYFTALK